MTGHYAESSENLNPQDIVFIFFKHNLIVINLYSFKHETTKLGDSTEGRRVGSGQNLDDVRVNE